MKYPFFAVAMLLSATGLAQAPAVTRLTEPQDDYPDVSPDGATILFQSNRGGHWQLWQIGSDGTGLRPLTTGPMNDRQPAWSPDGKQIAFSSDRGLANGARAVFVTGWPLGRTAIRKITRGEGQDVHPKWLRDGSGLVFNRIAADGKQADVHIVTLDGRERKIELGAGLNTYASIDQSRTRLVYRGTTAEAGPSGPAENSDVFIAGPDGSNKRRLTSDPAFDGWPAISPDGTTIAFASRRGGDKFRLFLMPIDGGVAREVPSPPGYHYTQPAWMPDGKALITYRWTADSAGETGQLVRIALP